MLLNLIALLVALGIIISLTAIYALVTRSAGIYQTKRQFWIVILVSAGISCLLTLALAIFADVSLLSAVIISAIVPFLVGSVFSKGDIYSSESVPPEESGETAEEAEPDEDVQGEIPVLAEENAARFARFSDLLN